MLRTFTVIYEPLQEGGYLVLCPFFRGLISYGENLDEARLMAKDALLCHCQGMLKEGDSIVKALQQEILIETLMLDIKEA
jgi:predicted RNase H-like HicB family nuclease